MRDQEDELEAMREEMVESFWRESPKGTTRAQVDRAIPLTAEFKAARSAWSAGAAGSTSYADHYRLEIWSRLAVEIELDKRITV